MSSSESNIDVDNLDEAALRAYESGTRVLSPAHFLVLCHALGKDPGAVARRALERVQSGEDGKSDTLASDREPRVK